MLYIDTWFLPSKNVNKAAYSFRLQLGWTVTLTETMFFVMNFQQNELLTRVSLMLTLNSIYNGVFKTLTNICDRTFCETS